MSVDTTATTAPLPVAYLLFPCQGLAFDRPAALVSLLPRDVTDLLGQMSLAERLREQRNGPVEIVYRTSLRIQYPRNVASLDCRLGSVGALPFAMAVDPSVAEDFLPPVLGGYEGELHVQEAIVSIAGTDMGRRFESVEATWSEVMLCRLATAQRRMVPKVFREFSSIDPRGAIDILNSGLIFAGSSEIARDIRSLLDPSDLVPLLEWPEEDVRGQAIAEMGRLRRSG